MGVFSRADHAFQKLNIGVKKSIGKDAGQSRGLLVMGLGDMDLVVKQEIGACGYFGVSFQCFHRKGAKGAKSTQRGFVRVNRVCD
jgi:hypothetical protein